MKPKYRARRRERHLNSPWAAEGYDSRFEWTIAMSLKENDVQFIHQPEAFNYIKECKYTPDFKITTRTGKVIYIETKGYWKSDERSKHKEVVRQNPHLDIRLLFMNANNKLNKNSNTTYADWCDRYKILWGHMKIPAEWLDE